MRNYKLNIIYLYKILQKYSDVNHILTMKDIQSEMKSIYAIMIICCL